MNGKGWEQSVYRTLEICCGILIFLAVGISLGEIVSRVFFHITYDFVIDLPVWIITWAILLISGPLLAENGHVSIDFVLNRLKGRRRLWVELFNITITAVYGLSITTGGFALVRMLYLRQAVFPKFISIPKWIVELCVPLGMGIFTIVSIIELFKRLRK